MKLTTLIFTVSEIDPQSSERKEAGKGTDLCIAQNIVKELLYIALSDMQWFSILIIVLLLMVIPVTL